MFSCRSLLSLIQVYQRQTPSVRVYTAVDGTASGGRSRSSTTRPAQLLLNRGSRVGRVHLGPARRHGVERLGSADLGSWTLSTSLSSTGPSRSTCARPCWACELESRPCAEPAEGRIVITSWNTGLNGEANRFRYATAKAGVLNLMRSVAIDVAADNIRVNAVCPGPTLSGMTKHLVESQSERYELSLRIVPQQRWARPEQVAEVILFLASPAASFVTGVAIPVDGGVSASTGQALPPTVA